MLLTIMELPVVAIVEDEPTMQRGLARLLNSAGFATEMFSTAEAFLAALPKIRATCVVVDIHLPGISGIELRRQLADSRFSVIFTTAGDTEDTRQAALQSGCVAYLEKPFPGKLLLEAIRKIPGYATTF